MPLGYHYTLGLLSAQYTMQANASLADQVFFGPVPDGMLLEVLAIQQIHSILGTDAGAVNLQVTKDTGTNAPGAGTNLLTNNSDAGFDLKAAVNTRQKGLLAASQDSLTLRAGDRLAVDFAGVLTAVAGVQVFVVMAVLPTGA